MKKSSALCDMFKQDIHMMLFEIKFLNTFGYLPHTQKKKCLSL